MNSKINLDSKYNLVIFNVLFPILSLIALSMRSFELAIWALLFGILYNTMKFNS